MTEFNEKRDYEDLDFSVTQFLNGTKELCRKNDIREETKKELLKFLETKLDVLFPTARLKNVDQLKLEARGEQSRELRGKKGTEPQSDTSASNIGSSGSSLDSLLKRGKAIQETRNLKAGSRRSRRHRKSTKHFKRKLKRNKKTKCKR
jgi:hypothetical protein